jgi:caa(3)-type oxidase subunit IV
MHRNGDSAHTDREDKTHRDPITVGWVVFILLVVLTVLEYVIFKWVDRNLPIMIAMNVADAALIMVYFMHLPRAWRREGDR